MSRLIRSFICPVFIQILLACAAVFILTKNGVVCGYSTVIGMVLIAVGGLSSALWGCVFQVRHNGKNASEITKDFFRVKTDPKGYLLTAAFLLVLFGGVFFGGSLNVSGVFDIPKVLLMSLVFGGIEELAWRYTFQPFLEKKFPYFAAALITFLCWGAWHFLFFYIDGSIASVNPVEFLFSLLTMCFMLSAIFEITGNLWLCVLAHSLINTLSQKTQGGSEVVYNASKVIIITAAVFLCTYKKKKEST